MDSNLALSWCSQVSADISTGNPAFAVVFGSLEHSAVFIAHEVGAR
jgi:hypothetical protein